MIDRTVTASNGTLVGIDVGGTFTDLIVYDRSSGEVLAVKVPSNRQEPDKAVIAALEKSCVPADHIVLIVHGTTVATNALLERRGASTAFVTTEGFRDVLELGRTTRLVPNTLYDPYFERPMPLVERRHRVTVRERTSADGEIAVPLDERELEALAEKLAGQEVEAVTVGFMNSYRNASHERLARDVLERHFQHVTVSTDILNEVREFERFSAAAINSYVMPVMASYAGRMAASIKESNAKTAFYTVASHGGLLSTRAVMAQPVRTVLSGPAAGIAATVHLARRIGRPNLVTYDMGGTSTDVALVHDYEFPLKRETILDGLILKLPQLDIHTIGAGGGSIAAIDAGGGLQLGPESAGANPGPACYGLGGTRPTVTDANAVLGRIGAGQELGKSLKIDHGRAVEAMQSIAGPAGLSADAMAGAVLKLGIAKMAAAVSEISTMRGFDPRDFTLLSYGGAGPLHAALVAAEAGMSEVIIPPNPGTFSAFGTLCSALRKDRSETVLKVFNESALDHAQRAVGQMADMLLAEFAAEGSNSGEVIFEQQFDMRYQGQAHELTITAPENSGLAGIAEIFETVFEREYGRRDKNREIELVNVRLVASIPLDGPVWRAPPDGDGQPGSRRRVMIDSGQIEIPVWSRDALTAHTVIHGPAIVEEMSSTTYLPPGWKLSVGEVGEMLLRQG